MTKKGQTKKIENLLNSYISTKSLVRWITYVEIILCVMGILFFSYKGGYLEVCSFLVGSIVVFFNFLMLGRILPSLISSGEVKSSVVSLLFSFYSRLFLTGIVLLICIVFFKLPIYPLVLGLSTVVLGIILWIIKHIFTTNHKEANSYVRSSSTRIAS